MASHGSFASGIKNSLDILLGKSDNVSVIDAYLTQDNFEEQLEIYLSTIPENEPVIMLSDLYGGSVNQKMVLHLTRPNTFLIAGINLPMVLSLALNTEAVTRDSLLKTVEESREALKLVEIQTKRVENEDFFGGS